MNALTWLLIIGGLGAGAVYFGAILPNQIARRFLESRGFTNLVDVVPTTRDSAFLGTEGNIFTRNLTLYYSGDDPTGLTWALAVIVDKFTGTVVRAGQTLAGPDFTEIPVSKILIAGQPIPSRVRSVTGRTKSPVVFRRTHAGQR